MILLTHISAKALSTVKTKNDKSYLRRYAGHVETGEDSFSDPVIGKVNV